MPKKRNIVFDGAAVEFAGHQLQWTRPKSKWGRLLVNCRNAVATVMGSRNVAYLELTSAIDVAEPFAVYRMLETGDMDINGGMRDCVCEVVYADEDSDSRMLFAEKMHQQAKTKVITGADGLIEMEEGLLPTLTLRVRVRA